MLKQYKSTPVQGMRVEKLSALATVFSAFSTIQGKTMAKFFLVLAPRPYKSYNYCPCPRPAAARPLMWSSPGQGPDSKCSKTAEIGCSYSELNSVIARLPLTKFERRHYKERGKNSARQCTDGLRATQIGQGAVNSFSTLRALIFN